jgi:polyisoprenoid-binding protein YceI
MKGHDMTRSKPLAWPALVAILLLSRTAAALDFYRTDPEHTSVVFGVAHAGLSFSYGMFREAAAQYWIDKTNPANCRFQFAVRTDSIDTNHAERDKVLRSDAFFDVERFRDIRFDSTRCEMVRSAEGGIVYKLSGNLTIRGVTMPVNNILLHMLGEGPGASGKDYRTGFFCQVQLKRSDFGMDKLLQNNVVGDAVGVNVSFEGVLQQPPTPAPPAVGPTQ